MSCPHLRSASVTSLASLMKEFFTVLSKPPGAGSSGGADSGSLKVLHSLMCLSCHNSVPDGRRDCAQSETHLFGVNIEFKMLYCFACKDYVYHKDVDSIRCQLLGKFDVGVGLRGVCNLGNTCFMNSVLQSLANIVPIREYFLSKEHNRSCSVARRAKLVRVRLEAAKAKAKAQPQAQGGPRKPNGKSKGHTKLPNRPAKRAKTGVDSVKEEKRNGSTARMATRYAQLWDRPWDKHSDKPLFSSKSRLGSLTNYFPEPTSPKSKQLLAERDSEIPVCIACEFENFIGNMYAGTNSEKPLVLSDLLYGVWQHSSILRGYAQQDAHEFFSFIVNSVHGHLRNEMRLKKLAVPTVDQTNGGKNPPPCAKKSFCECTIHEALGGQLCSEVECGSCGEVSASFEDCFDVSLDIALEMGQNAQVSVESLMNRFIRTERLVDKIKCEKCGSNQESLKRMSIFKVPKIFVLHLKRFRQGLTLAECIKMNHFVEFKMENFDITAHMHSKSEKPGPKLMKLTSVIQHSGKNLDSGHYIAYIRHGDHWFKCNDDCISRVSEDEVKSCQAYLLFYQQLD